MADGAPSPVDPVDPDPAGQTSQRDDAERRRGDDALALRYDLDDLIEIHPHALPIVRTGPHPRQTARVPQWTGIHSKPMPQFSYTPR